MHSQPNTWSRHAYLYLPTNQREPWISVKFVIWLHPAGSAIKVCTLFLRLTSSPVICTLQSGSHSPAFSSNSRTYLERSTCQHWLLHQVVIVIERLSSTLLLGPGSASPPSSLPPGCIVVSNLLETSGTMITSSCCHGCELMWHCSLWDLFDFLQALTLAYSILYTVLGQLGGCRHLYYLQMNPAQAIKASRINWITQPVTIYALATGKISVAFLIMRIMGKSKWRKAFLIYGAMIGSFLFCTIAIILTFAQCRPVTALWNPELSLTGKATCWPPQRQSDFSLFTGSM